MGNISDWIPSVRDILLVLGGGVLANVVGIAVNKRVELWRDRLSSKRREKLEELGRLRLIWAVKLLKNPHLCTLEYGKLSIWQHNTVYSAQFCTLALLGVIAILGTAESGKWIYSAALGATGAVFFLSYINMLRHGRKAARLAYHLGKLEELESEKADGQAIAEVEELLLEDSD